MDQDAHWISLRLHDAIESQIQSTTKMCLVFGGSYSARLPPSKDYLRPKPRCSKVTTSESSSKILASIYTRRYTISLSLMMFFHPKL